ncbi:molybdenum cofactor guanylyltransferase [Nocardioides sp. Leaf285]|uniref:molybdenum cofactor guanylyltransferase n=1 Tax=Nocardioides sp. Leaf285 TaxID=1736322 RepID=UPI00070393B6|nr:NTP transferase domain-containing protein [Nocardioides sp. Leaf285]KQP63765.1 molybdopterin-guanine dinucleotide biosynthesis protein [Nocardioides sp. Leaf285]
MPGSSPTGPLLDPDTGGFCAVVLAGGTAVRLDGVDKAGVELHGRSLLTHALDALVDAAEVVVVGDPVPTERPVTFCRESPRHGGPVAALLTGRDALVREPRTLGVLAVDMPRVTAHTFRRLHDALLGEDGPAEDLDGARLVAPDGRHQLALVLRTDRLDAVRPDHEGQHGMAMRHLLRDLRLAEVAALGEEHRDVDTWADLRDLAEPPG